MPLVRLLAVAMLFSACILQAAAQSQPKQSNASVQDAQRENSQPQNADLIEAQARERTTEWRPESDTTCYFIRSYVVARDSRHSDSTHYEGYSTCVPGERVRMYSTVERVRSPNLDSGKRGE